MNVGSGRNMSRKFDSFQSVGAPNVLPSSKYGSPKTVMMDRWKQVFELCVTLMAFFRVLTLFLRRITAAGRRRKAAHKPDPPRKTQRK
jgi:hypothetical protein